MFNISKFTQHLPKAIFCGVFAAATAFSASTASAQDLDQIKSRGKLIVGIQADAPPFGFLDESGKNVGIDAEVSTAIGKKLGVEVEFVPVTAANRIPILLTKKVDVLISQLGMNPERAKQIQFSRPYALSEMNVMGPKDATLANLGELQGNRVGVARGSVPDILLSKEPELSSVLQRFDDDASTVQALLTGQVDFIGGTSIYNFVASQRAPDQYEPKLVLSRLYLGVGMRYGDKALLDAINAAIVELEKSGEIPAIVKNWLLVDLPELPEHVEGVTTQ